MQAFEYHRPSSLADAAKLAGKGDDAKLLAGGHAVALSATFPGFLNVTIPGMEM